MLACTDGYVLADIDASGLAQALKGANLSLPSLAQMKRDQAAALLARLGLPSAPVLSIKEASELEQTKTRGVWTTVSDGELDWPVVGCPLRLQRTPASIASRAPDVDQDGAAIRQQLRLQ